MQGACYVGVLMGLAEEGASAVRVAGVDVVLFKRGGLLYAYVNCCPHQGRALDFSPGKFLLTDDDHMVCPSHGATFDIKTGNCLTGPCAGASLRPVPVRVKGDEIWLGPICM